MRAAFYFRDIQERKILSAVNLLRGLQDGVHVLVSETRIDFHFFSNKNRDAIILLGCDRLKKNPEAPAVIG